MSRRGVTLAGRRVLISGAARGIGALTARRLHERGAKVALLGIEPDLLEAVAGECGGAPWQVCDVSDRERVDACVEESVSALGGLDVVIANAGVAAQLPLVGGDPRVFEKTISVNVLGSYYLIRAAGPHISHRDGYALLTSSLAAAVHVPLLGAYCASKAAVEAMGDSLRIELSPTGARVGVAYYGELSTDMTSRGFDTKAAKRMPAGGNRGSHVTPVEHAIDAIERGIQRRSRRVVAPRRVAAILPVRMVVQRAAEQVLRPGLAKTMEIARSEQPPLTTPQPDEPG